MMDQMFSDVNFLSVMTVYCKYFNMHTTLSAGGKYFYHYSEIILVVLLHTISLFWKFHELIFHMHEMLYCTWWINESATGNVAAENKCHLLSTIDIYLTTIFFRKLVYYFIKKKLDLALQIYSQPFINTLTLYMYSACLCRHVLHCYIGEKFTPILYIVYSVIINCWFLQ